MRSEDFPVCVGNAIARDVSVSVWRWTNEGCDPPEVFVLARVGFDVRAHKPGDGHVIASVRPTSTGRWVPWWFDFGRSEHRHWIRGTSKTTREGAAEFARSKLRLTVDLVDADAIGGHR